MSDLVVKDSIFFDIDAMKGLINVCTSIAKTPFLKPELRGKPEAVLSIVLMAKELNIPPMTALTKMHFIQGQPTLPSIMKLALARRALPDMEVVIEVDNKNQTVTVTGKRDAESAQYSATWDMARAAAMGLSGRDQYKRQALTMFRHRATSEVIDVIAGDVLFGIHSTEDFQDFNGREIVNYQQIERDEVAEYEAKEREAHPEWFSVGPEFKINHGKWRGHQLRDHDVPEIEEYVEKLEMRAEKGLKQWEDELLTVFKTYLMEFPDVDQFEFTEESDATI